jgi:hypothetical protein
LTKGKEPSLVERSPPPPPPEDSPPRGGTPESPNKLEFLKIHASDCHINKEEVDYNKEDLRNIITL